MISPLVDRSTCPNAAEHIEAPIGYLAWHEWVEEKVKTHVCRRCPGCGLWTVWVLKENVEAADIQPETFYRAVCSVCEESPDEDGGEYRDAPEEAERVAWDHCWERTANGRLVCASCLSQDAEAPSRLAPAQGQKDAPR